EDPVEEIERSAASVEEAVESALGELGISEQEARITVVQEPRAGFLGIKGQPAIVRVRAARPGPGAGDATEEDGELIEEQTDAAGQVRKTGRPQAMEAMSAFERKIVHDAVSEVGGVETESEGEEPNRRVMIRLVGD